MGIVVTSNSFRDHILGYVMGLVKPEIWRIKGAWFGAGSGIYFENLKLALDAVYGMIGKIYSLCKIIPESKDELIFDFLLVTRKYMMYGNLGKRLSFIETNKFDILWFNLIRL